jgi:hypothetical protein
MAFQSGPRSPSAISRSSGEGDRKNMPDWQVADNRIISNLVQKTANKNWIQTDYTIDRNARTLTFPEKVSSLFVDFTIFMQQRGPLLYWDSLPS